MTSIELVEQCITDFIEILIANTFKKSSLLIRYNFLFLEFLSYQKLSTSNLLYYTDRENYVIVEIDQVGLMLNVSYLIS